jgi:uncharacterized membrane protein YccC
VSINRPWIELRAFFSRWRAQLVLSIRVTTAAIAALVLAQAMHLTLPLWSVLTAVIVTQISVGGSLRATTNYLIGTLSGAIYGGAIGVLIPHASELALLGVLVLAVAPLALIASMKPSLSVAAITAIIVLLVPTMTHASPTVSAFDRILEVAVGAVTGFAVSLWVFPSNAHRLVAEAAARTLNQMARALEMLLAGFPKGLDVDTLHSIQDGIGQALTALNAVGAEAEHERSAHLATGPSTGPLLRVLLRLRHDLVMIGRAAVTPLPDVLLARLQSPLARAGTAFADYLRASGGALLARRGPPSRDSVAPALLAYNSEIAALRREGLTRGLSAEAAEHFFALGFALEQMNRNFNDLGRCVTEWAVTPGRAATR